jgi:hypothetical protein
MELNRENYRKTNVVPRQVQKDLKKKYKNALLWDLGRNNPVIRLQIGIPVHYLNFQTILLISVNPVRLNKQSQLQKNLHLA